MLKKIILIINNRLNTFFNNVAIVSEGIDKNTIFPCFKVNVLNYFVTRINEDMFKYIINLAINYYPILNKDNRIELLEVQEQLANVFIFSDKDYTVTNFEVVDNEEFITAMLDIEILTLNRDLTSKIDIGMVKVPNGEIIEDINMKERLKNDTRN